MGTRYPRYIDVIQFTLNLFEIVNTIYLHYYKNINYLEKRHIEAMNISSQHFKEETLLSKRTYLMESFHTLEQHFQQLNADLMASGHESERDMFDQRNLTFQTIIVTSSVMFASITTVISQGVIDQKASEVLFILYSFFSSISLGFLCLSMTINFEVILRCSHFMYLRAKAHAALLKKAINDTSVMIETMRSLRVNEGDIPERPIITNMDIEEAKKLFEQYEERIHGYMETREKIIEGVYQKTMKYEKKITFQKFWNEYCKFWSGLAITFYHLGSISLVFAIGLFFWVEFSLTYHNFTAAAIAVIVVFVTIVSSLSLIRKVHDDNKNFSNSVKEKSHQISRIYDNESDASGHYVSLKESNINERSIKDDNDN
eukprot:gene9948-13381_t